MKSTQSVKEVIRTDLDYICNQLEAEFEQISGKKLLITGGAGFLGYYLVQSVLHWNSHSSAENSVKVTVFDNYSRGVPAWLTGLKDHPLLHLVKHDVTNPLPPGMGDFEYVIHGASIASPTYYRQHPIATMDANVNGLWRLLDYIRYQKASGKDVGGFLFFSSSEIYGDPPPERIPTPESYRGNVSCTGPRACYDEAKRFGETLCVNFAQQHGLPVKAARPFNNYGPGLKITDRRAPSDFARDVVNGDHITLLSDGSPTRTFCYVADAVIGYYKVLVNGGAGEAYNIGVDGPEVSIADFAQLMASTGEEVLGYEGEVVRGTSSDDLYLVDNPDRRCPMIDKARSELGYNPSIDLEEGVRRSLIWYQKHNTGAEA